MRLCWVFGCVLLALGELFILLIRDIFELSAVRKFFFLIILPLSLYFAGLGWVFLFLISFSFMYIIMAWYYFLEHIIALSFPITTLCLVSADITRLWNFVNIYFLHRYLLFAVRFVVVFLEISVSCLLALGVMFVLKSAAVGVVILFQLALRCVLSDENLPYLTCCVLVCCYLWNSYRWFTHTYQNLAVELFEQYDLLTDSARNKASKRNLIKGDHCRGIDKLKTFPKELFDMACQELMPIRQSIRIMMAKASLSVIYVCLVFSLTMLLNTSSEKKSLVTFLVGSLPMIVTIYLNRKRHNNIKEKALKIAQEFMNSRLPCNRGQRSYRWFFFAKSGDENSFLNLFLGVVVSCFISLVVYLSFSIFRPCLYCCFVTLLNSGKYSFNLLEISQLVYGYPLSSELVCFP